MHCGSGEVRGRERDLFPYFVFCSDVKAGRSSYSSKQRPVRGACRNAPAEATDFYFCIIPTARVVSSSLDQEGGLLGDCPTLALPEPSLPSCLPFHFSSVHLKEQSGRNSECSSWVSSILFATFQSFMLPVSRRG